jgi:mevalonate kinase
LKATALAPGKIILTGEHFVVYGVPALVMAIDRYVRVNVEERSDRKILISSSLGPSGTYDGKEFIPESGGVEAKTILEPIRISAETVLKHFNEKYGLNIEITSTLPVAVGLGSSGASAVSTVAAVGKLLRKNLSREQIVRLSAEAERFVHVNPSGIDQSISTYGGVIAYKLGKEFSRLKIKSGIPLVIGNTGIRRNTGKLVGNVRLRMEQLPKVMKPLLDVSERITIQASAALKQGDMDRLGLLMDMNHGLLMSLGVSNEALDKLVYAAKKGGALGAKLTGAGGGGCMIALTSLTGREAVAQSIADAEGTPIMVTKTDEGVRSWIVT